MTNNDSADAPAPDSAAVAEPAAPGPAASKASKTPAEPTKAERIASLIRNGLSNGPISQSSQTWDHLNVRLDEIVAAILKEV